MSGAAGPSSTEPLPPAAAVAKSLSSSCLPSPGASRQVSPANPQAAGAVTTPTASMSQGQSHRVHGESGPPPGQGRHPGHAVPPPLVLPPTPSVEWRRQQPTPQPAQTPRFYPQQQQQQQQPAQAIPAQQHGVAPGTFPSPQMGRELVVSQTPQYQALLNLVRRTDPAVVRQVVRDTHETTLLGSDYHFAFLLNTVFHKAPPLVLERSIAEFGDVMVNRAKKSILSHLTKGDLDSVADVLLSNVSNDFLDRALAKRLESIRARSLVNALAKAERLGYDEKDVVEERRDGSEYVIPYLRQDLVQGQPSPQAPAVAGQASHAEFQPSTFQPDDDMLTTYYRCRYCLRPCSGKTALKYHQVHSCSQPGAFAMIDKTMCAHCGKVFPGESGLGHHSSSHGCGSYSNAQKEAMLPVLEAYYRKITPSQRPTTKKQADAGQRVSAAGHGDTLPSLSSSQSRDPYAALSPDRRAAFDLRMKQVAEKYGERMRNVSHLPEPQRSTELARIKNTFNTAQSMTRKAFGISLKKRRPMKEIDQEREHPSSKAGSFPASPASREPQSPHEGPPKKKMRTVSEETSTGTSRGQGSMASVAAWPRVPVARMGGLDNSAATAEVQDPTALSTPAPPLKMEAARLAAASIPSKLLDGTQGDPMELEGGGSSTETDSDSEDEDVDEEGIPATLPTSNP